MKKITLLLLMLISGTVFGQTNVPASATIVSAISLNSDSGLFFGSFTEGQAGSITIDLNGAATTTGTVKIITGSSTAAAQLTINAADTYTYNLTYGLNPAITNGTDSMPISGITAGASGTGTGADETFSLGATLTADGSESPGLYQGNIVVTAAYN